ncbi:hypothetical protein BJY52DRAFT_1186958 [Lactarius psammicola]|nr:hypothetical protein BJY52DRAFT_1186958 [Lactarius psammicola]
MSANVRKNLIQRLPEPRSSPELPNVVLNHLLKDLSTQYDGFHNPSGRGFPTWLRRRTDDPPLPVTPQGHPRYELLDARASFLLPPLGVVRPRPANPCLTSASSAPGRAVTASLAGINDIASDSNSGWNTNGSPAITGRDPSPVLTARLVSLHFRR